MEKLSGLELLAYNISALEPCIKRLQKWPSPLIICGVVNGTTSIVNTFADPNLSAVEVAISDHGVDFYGKYDRWGFKCPKMDLLNAAVIVCYVIDCACETWISPVILLQQIDCQRQITDMRVRGEMGMDRCLQAVFFFAYRS